MLNHILIRLNRSDKERKKGFSFVYLSLIRNIEAGASKLLTFGNKNKIAFILYSAHLIVTLKLRFEITSVRIKKEKRLFLSFISHLFVILQAWNICHKRATTRS